MAYFLCAGSRHVTSFKLYEQFIVQLQEAGRVLRKRQSTDELNAVSDALLGEIADRKCGFVVNCHALSLTSTTDVA